MGMNDMEGVRYTDCRVLVVDDNAVNSKLACKMLSGFGISADEADSGETAVALAKERRYDLIFMDHLMPGMDGIQAAEAILADYPSRQSAPPIIAMTGNESEGARELYLSHGFRDYIRKPMDRARLEQALETWLPENRRQQEVQARKKPLTAAELIKLFMAGVDVIGAANRLGSVEGYMELLDVFHAEGQAKPALLRELLRQENLEDYAVEVHGLKSAAANIGAKQLSQLALDHETAAKQGDWGFIRENIDALLAGYEKTLSEIRRVLEKQAWGRFAKPETAGLPPLEGQALTAQLREILRHIEHFQSREAAEAAGIMLERGVAEPARPELERIQTLLRLKEDDRAEDALRQLIGSLEISS